MTALSIAKDYGMGQPFEYTLQFCVLATRLGGKLGFGEEELALPIEYRFTAKYHHIYCNAKSPVTPIS